jgi:hypothetical protein
MTEAIHIISLGAEYIGDLLLCIGAVTFAVLVNSEDGLK